MMEQWIYDTLESLFSTEMAQNLYTPAMLLVIFTLAFILFWFCHRVISMVVRVMTRKTDTDWDDDLLNDRVLSAVSHLAPALLVAYMLPDAFDNDSTTSKWLSKATDFYILWAFIHLINSFLQSLFDALDKRDRFRIHTMRGVLQMLKLFFIIIGVIIGISILFGQSPIAILTALGASAAVLMLVFQDTILGLVAGIQLTVNDMLKKGDWIVVPKANANGVVEEVSLTTVKVRNWDNSVTTIPPYTLIKDSFHNYDPMRQAGARRVSRYIYIDVNSIRFLDKDEINQLIESHLITTEDLNQSSPTANIQLLSTHLERYIQNHPDVRTDQLFMVRQLQPTPQGIPLELYFYTSVTEWKEYEHIQARVFDYIYASVQAFFLKIYQAPAGSDFQNTTQFNIQHL